MKLLGITTIVIRFLYSITVICTAPEALEIASVRWIKNCYAKSVLKPEFLPPKHNICR